MVAWTAATVVATPSAKTPPGTSGSGRGGSECKAATRADTPHPAKASATGQTGVIPGAPFVVTVAPPANAALVSARATSARLPVTLAACSSAQRSTRKATASRTGISTGLTAAQTSVAARSQ